MNFFRRLFLLKNIRKKAMFIVNQLGSKPNYVGLDIATYEDGYLQIYYHESISNAITIRIPSYDRHLDMLWISDFLEVPRTNKEELWLEYVNKLYSALKKAEKDGNKITRNKRKKN